MPEAKIDQEQLAIDGILAQAEAVLQKGGPSAAKGLYFGALTKIVDKFGNTDPKVGFCLRNLGDIYFAEGDFENAAQCYSRLLNFARANLNRDNRDLIAILFRLAVTCDKMNVYSEAESFYTEAEQLARKVLPSQDRFRSQIHRAHIAMTKRAANEIIDGQPTKLRCVSSDPLIRKVFRTAETTVVEEKDSGLSGSQEASLEIIEALPQEDIPEKFPDENKEFVQSESEQCDPIVDLQILPDIPWDHHLVPTNEMLEPINENDLAIVAHMIPPFVPDIAEPAATNQEEIISTAFGTNLIAEEVVSEPPEGVRKSEFLSRKPSDLLDSDEAFTQMPSHLAESKLVVFDTDKTVVVPDTNKTRRSDPHTLGFLRLIVSSLRVLLPVIVMVAVFAWFCSTHNISVASYNLFTEKMSKFWDVYVGDRLGSRKN